ncbi:MAG: hypothetical protein LBB62_07155 [Proteiniphilum sp.]|jgi:hypothetical protein|nr:hypothetical protein [Proteiniphilum sp.]
MDIRVDGSDIKDSGKKIGVINGRDILTYPALKKIGEKWNDGDVFDSSGSKVGYGNDGIVKLFLKL